MFKNNTQKLKISRVFQMQYEISFIIGTTMNLNIFPRINVCVHPLFFFRKQKKRFEDFM